MMTKTDKSDLQRAMETYHRCKDYEPLTLSPNERDIIALGKEVERLQRELKKVRP